MYIEEFHKWLLDQGRAAKTINAYLRSVTDLAKWYQDREGEEFNLAVIRADVLHDYRFYLETFERKLPTTVNKLLLHSKQIGRF